MARPGTPASHTAPSPQAAVAEQLPLPPQRNARWPSDAPPTRTEAEGVAPDASSGRHVPTGAARVHPAASRSVAARSPMPEAAPPGLPGTRRAAGVAGPIDEALRRPRVGVSLGRLAHRG